MPRNAEIRNMALYCDFENIALGVHDANYERFNVAKVLEKLLLKGNIVVKKAYCDWSRYREYKAPMHEASFELIEIPHVRQSGKNSADIRMVVDALDLCYTKEHVDAFVIISGDSDFSPLVSKLRENDKIVIGVGVKNSTSDLLIANCDEFIYYDDLVRRQPRRASTPRKPPVKKATRSETLKAPQGDALKAADADAVKTVDVDAVKAPNGDAVKFGEDEKHREAWNLIVETYEALMEERGEGGKVWGSMIKQTLKRRKPGFSESYYGFRSFNEMLEQAASQSILELERDEKSGGYIITACHTP